MSGNKPLPPARGRSEARAERLSPPATAAQLHNWQRQPPRLQARDVARQAGINPEPAHLIDPLHAACSVTVRKWDNALNQGGGTDERGADERWAIGITIAGLQFTVELAWQLRRAWRRWLLACGSCSGWKRTLFLVGGRLVCAKCGGVSASATVCPSILKPVKALSQAEQSQLTERKRRKDSRKFARIAGAQVFPEGSVGVRVAQTLTHAPDAQSNDGDTQD